MCLASIRGLEGQQVVGRERQDPALGDVVADVRLVTRHPPFEQKGLDLHKAAGLQPGSSLEHAEEFDLEDERCVRRNRVARAGAAVRQ